MAYINGKEILFSANIGGGGAPIYRHNISIYATYWDNSGDLNNPNDYFEDTQTCHEVSAEVVIYSASPILVDTVQKLFNLIGTKKLGWRGKIWEEQCYYYAVYDAYFKDNSTFVYQTMTMDIGVDTVDHTLTGVADWDTMSHGWRMSVHDIVEDITLEVNING